MIPKILCTDCGSQLQWTDKFCSRCGKTIDWPASFSSSPTSPAPTALPVRSTTLRVDRLVEQAGTTVRCKSCGSENPSAAELCLTCGHALIGKTEKRAKHEVHSKQKQDVGHRVVPVVGSWKLVAGFAAFLATGITLMQLFGGSNKAPVTIPSQPSSQPSANMQVLPQIEEMERQVVANPSNHEQILKLANFLQDNRFYERAVKYYKDFLSHHPKDANARVDMGICYNDMGDLEEAKKQIRLALEHEPKHLFAHFNLGIVYLRGGEVEKANEWFKKVVELDPKNEIAQRAQQLLSQHNPQNLQTK